MDERRRVVRITVPTGKLCCQIIEPQPLAEVQEHAIIDINPLGISFIWPKNIERDQEVKLRVRFPYSTYEDAVNVWGKVSYSRKIPNKDEHIVGIEYIRKK